MTARKVGNLTGPGHTDRFGVGGTDLGVMAAAPDGRIVAVFGDTFDRATVGGPGWRSPVALFADPASVGSGLRWTGSAGAGDYAHPVVRRPRRRWFGPRVTTVLPTDVLTLGDTMYLHVMACAGLHNVRWTEIHRSTDDGATWEPTGTTWPGDRCGGLFQMLTWERGGDGCVYALTTGFRRDAGLILHRVPEERLADPDAWVPWGHRDGQWAWGNPPTPVLDGAFGELCLRRVQGRWLLVLFDAGHYRIDVLGPTSLTADLHRAPRRTVLHGCSWDGEDHASGRVAQLYGGYVVPGSTLPELHLLVSQWNTATNWPYRAMQFRVDVSGLFDVADAREPGTT